MKIFVRLVLSSVLAIVLVNAQSIKGETILMRAWTNQPPFTWSQKINPVWWWGNSDDPVPPFWYEPGNSHRNRDWFFRNPMSNFCNYVIGVADKDTHRSGLYPKLVGNPNGGWNFTVTRWKFLFFPFVDYKARSVHFEFYFGWRERGNFGIACRSNHSDPLPRAITTAVPDEAPRLIVRQPVTRR